MVNDNPFIKNDTKQEEVKVATKVEEVKVVNNGRKVIDETTVQESNWVNLPNKTQIGDVTPELKINVGGYYNCEGKNLKNSTTGEDFYSGLSSGKGTDYKEYGEFIIEGIVDGKKANLRLSNWETKIKMDNLTKYCRDNNYTLANQIIQFKRIGEGQLNAGKNWELFVPSLKIVISGKNSEIKTF